jgi:hypothetical protein
MGEHRNVRISGRRINDEWGEIIVWVDGKPVANFSHSSNPGDWGRGVTSKLDALEAARSRAGEERDKNLPPAFDASLKGPRKFADDDRERKFRLFSRQADEMLERYKIETTGKSICGPDDDPSTSDK